MDVITNAAGLIEQKLSSRNKVGDGDMLRIFIPLMLLPFFSYSIDFDAFDNGKNFYMVISNSSNKPLMVDDRFIFDDCRSRANICLEVFVKDGLGIEMLQMAIDYDFSFSKENEVFPGRMIGYLIPHEVVKRRFGIESGSYLLVFRYRDWSKNKHYQSEPILVEF